MPPAIRRTTDIRSRTIVCLLKGIFQNAFGFAAIFVALWLGVDVGLIYHGGGVIVDFPVFYWGWDFARETLARPSGAAGYLSSLLMQTLFFSWFGALALTLQSASIYPLLNVCCDICRPDLLFELELDAIQAGIP